MKRSPGPIPCSPLTTSSTASASASSRWTRDCIRAVSESRGRWTPGRSISASCQPASTSVAMPRGRAPGRLRPVGDDRDLGAGDRVDERRLADVRPPREPDEAGPGHAPGRSGGPHRQSPSLAPAAPASRRRRARGRSRRGAALRGRRLGDVARLLGTDDDVSKLAGPRWPRPRRSGTRARRWAHRGRGALGSARGSDPRRRARPRDAHRRRRRPRARRRHVPAAPPARPRGRAASLNRRRLRGRARSRRRRRRRSAARAGGGRRRRSRSGRS